MYTYMCINILLSKKTERLSDFRFISTCIYLMKIKLLKIKYLFIQQFILTQNNHYESLDVK